MRNCLDGHTQDSWSMLRYPSGDRSGVAFPRVGTGTRAAVADMDSGIKDTFSQSAHTKLCGVVTHWREGMPCRGTVTGWRDGAV